MERDGCLRAFTVIAGRVEDHVSADRIHRFSAAARVDPDLALACCQARAVSSHLYQQQVPGSWFDMEFLRILATC
jgi:hypothetical protein